jgi:anthranilate phosphoribosyltransferase
MQKEKKQFMVIHSLDGYDEISLTSGIKVFSPEGETLLSPESFNLPYNTPSSLHGGSNIEEAAAIMLAVLENRASQAQQNTVLANSALAVSCYHGNGDLDESMAIAREAVESGKALKCFRKLLEMQ